MVAAEDAITGHAAARGVEPWRRARAQIVPRPVPSRATAPAARWVLLLLLACSAACASASHGAEYDPWQPVNRRVFAFNMKVDEYLLEPVGRGWESITSEGVRAAFGRFFANLRFPVNLVNNLLQGKLDAAVEETGRFVVNTTVGLLGFFDPATSASLPAHPEDFDQTLGAWGLGPGPYLVLPFIGPSSARGTAGLVGDWIVPPWWRNHWAVITVDTVNDRAINLQLVEDARAASLDFYAFVRNAYLQRRRALVADQEAASIYQTGTRPAGVTPQDAPTDDLYADPLDDDGDGYESDLYDDPLDDAEEDVPEEE